MKNIFSLFIAAIFVGCTFGELTQEDIKKMVIDYFTPYTTIKIAKPVGVNVIRVEQKSKDSVVAEVCYSFKFLTSYKDLVATIKKNPHSFVAQFDGGLIALFGRKFGDFIEGEIKTRCDEVFFQRRYYRWMIKRI